MARRKRFGRPVKVALIHHSPEMLRAKPVGTAKSAKAPQIEVKHSFKRTERLRAKAVKHSFALPS